jgi:hypothetical protein
VKPSTTRTVTPTSRTGSGLQPITDVDPSGVQGPASGQTAVGNPETAQPGDNERKPAPWEERRRKILESKTNPEELEKAQQMLEQHLERVREARQKEIDQGGVAPVAANPVGAPPVAPAPPMFNPPVGIDTITLYLDPPEKVCSTGQTFSVNVQMENPQRKSFDEIGFVLRYDKNILQALDGDEKMPGLNLSDSVSNGTFPWKRGEGVPGYESRIDPVSGLIIYTAKWDRKAPLEASGTVASVTFEMIGSADSAIDFVFADNVLESKEPLTRVRLAGQDVLGSADAPEDGVSGGRVKSYALLADGGTRGEYAVPVAREAKDYNTLIVIRPSKEYVRPGEEFDMLIDIENPEKVQFDDLMLFLGYNRKYLQASDHDTGNCISNGINVFDGDYHGVFPFNLYKMNRVDSEEGVILYRMGALKSALNGSGTAASIRFRALRPTTGTGSRIQVGFLKGRYESGLFHRGEDVLGGREESGDGFEADPVYILPAFASIRGE